MATHYVNSAAAGANNGTTEADAWTSLTSAVGVAAGDVVRISHTHNQNPGASGSYNFSFGTMANPVVLISVDFSTDAYTPASAAQFSGASSDIAILGNVITYGLNHGVADDATFGNTSAEQRQRHIDMVCDIGDDITIIADQGLIEFEGATFDHVAGTTQSHNATDRTVIVSYRDCTWTGTAGFLTTVNDGGEIIFEDCDLTIFSTLFANVTRGWKVIVRRCKVASGVVFGTIDSPFSSAIMEQCDDGTIATPPLGLSTYATFWGIVSATTARYRTGGADDGANDYSWEMAANVSALEIHSALRTPPITRRTAADGSISSATARGIFTSTRCGPLATPAALTTDGVSTWNGTNVGTKQKITHTLTNGATLTVYVASAGTLNNDDFWVEISEPDQVGGPVSVVCCLAKPSTTVYVDAKIEISSDDDGETYFVNGVQVMDETTAAAGGLFKGTIIQNIGTY